MRFRNDRTANTVGQLRAVLFDFFRSEMLPLDSVYGRTTADIVLFFQNEEVVHSDLNARIPFILCPRLTVVHTFLTLFAALEESLIRVFTLFGGLKTGGSARFVR